MQRRVWSQSLNLQRCWAHCEAVCVVGLDLNRVWIYGLCRVEVGLVLKVPWVTELVSGTFYNTLNDLYLLMCSCLFYRLWHIWQSKVYTTLFALKVKSLAEYLITCCYFPSSSPNNGSCNIFCSPSFLSYFRGRWHQIGTKQLFLLKSSPQRLDANLTDHQQLLSWFGQRQIHSEKVETDSKERAGEGWREGWWLEHLASSEQRSIVCQWLTVEQNAFIIFIFYTIEEFLKHQLAVVVANHQKFPVPLFPNSEM